MAAQDFLSTYGYDLDNTVPERAPVIKEKVKPKLVPNKPRTKAQLKEESKRAFWSSVSILMVSAFLLVTVGSLIYGRVKIMEITYEIDDLKAVYSEQLSENVRLESEVKKLCSINNISAYAEEKLGMIKKDEYKIFYFSVDSETETAEQE